MRINDWVRQIAAMRRRQRELRELRRVDRTFTAWAECEEGAFQAALLDMARTAKVALDRLEGRD